MSDKGRIMETDITMYTRKRYKLGKNTCYIKEYNGKTFAV